MLLGGIAVASTISGTIPDGYLLADASLNPVTILGASSNAAALEGETIAAWTVVNQGTIDGGPVSSVDLLAGGIVSNAAGVWIGSVYGVAIQGVAGTVANGGSAPLVWLCRRRIACGRHPKRLSAGPAMKRQGRGLCPWTPPRAVALGTNY
jgi:hypothetical protein